MSNNESRNSDQINETTQHLLSSQSVCYSQKLHGKRDFPNLANSRTSQLPKYLTEYQNVKVVKSKLKIEKSYKNKHKSNVILKENK